MPTIPVTIEQRGCVYAPRIVGVRVGQPLEVRNSDPLTHNVRGISASTNGFNLGQPAAAAPLRIQLLAEERMVQLKCDIHSWMTAFVAVVSHPYFAVSGTDGSFRIGNVPPGTYNLRLWHERYGIVTSRIRVQAGAAATLELTYPAAPAPAAPPLGLFLSRPGTDPL